MPRTRDRHARGLRGPLAMRHEWGPHPVPLTRPSRTQWFHACVEASLEVIARHNPDVLRGTVVGVEEVPHLATRWTGDRVPMSAALEPTEGQEARIVVYQRPLEFRATSRSDLRRLVHRTIVEQLSALTGLGVEDIVGIDTDFLDD